MYLSHLSYSVQTWERGGGVIDEYVGDEPSRGFSEQGIYLGSLARGASYLKIPDLMTVVSAKIGTTIFWLLLGAV